MSRIAENLLVQLVERQPEAVDLVVLLDTSNGREGRFPVTEILNVQRRLDQARVADERVVDIDGILIEQSAWGALSYALGYFMGANLDQFGPADSE